MFKAMLLELLFYLNYLMPKLDTTLGVCTLDISFSSQTIFFLKNKLENREA